MLSSVIRGSSNDASHQDTSYQHQLVRETPEAVADCPGFNHRILVPRTSARIRVHGFAAVVAGPCSALFLGPDDRFDRSALSDDLFIADAIQVPADVALALRQALQPRFRDRGQRFPMPWARLGPEQFLRLRLIIRNSHQNDEYNDELATWTHWVLRSAALEWRKRPVPLQIASLRPVERSRFCLAQDMAAYIDSHWQRNVSLTELASVFDLSSFHLLRAFRRSMALTPHQYLLQLRLRRALDLIEGGRIRIADAALALGFCSHGHFSSAFRNVFGMTPIEFGGYRRCQPEALRRDPTELLAAELAEA